MDINAIKVLLTSLSIQFGLKVLTGVLILIGGVILARWVGSIMARGLEKNELEPPVRLLLVRAVRILVFGLTLIIACDQVGFKIAGLLTGLGVAGVGIGLAMQGVLSNIVAGLTIIFTKPFRVGEYIEVAGVNGQVTMIELCSTLLALADKSRVIIPNRKIVGEIVHNYGSIRQLSMTVGVSYQTDVPVALNMIREILAANRRILQDPAPGLGVKSLDEFAITIAISPWTGLADYGPAKAEVYEEIVARFRARGIEIPFPQREVRMLTP